MKTKTILGIAAVTLLVAVALVGAGAADNPVTGITPAGPYSDAATLVADLNDTTKGGVAGNAVVDETTGAVKLLKNIGLRQAIRINGNITIDLNGKSIKPENWNTSGLPATNPCKDALLGVMYYGILTINDSSNGSGSIDTEGNGTVMSAVKVTLKGEKSADWNEQTQLFDKYATLVVNGGKLIGTYYAVSGNGDRHGTDIDIHGGELTATNAGDNLGIYHPQHGYLLVDGNAYIHGYSTGIEMRAGYLDVNGGIIESTSPQSAFQWVSNGSGSTIIGSAVAIAQHTTNHIIIVTINDGTLKGAAALTQASTGDGNAPEKIAIYITGGNFISTAEAPFVYHHTQGTPGDYTIDAINFNDYKLLYNHAGTTGNEYAKIISGGTFPVRTSEELARYYYFRDTDATTPNVTLQVIADVELKDGSEAVPASESYAEIKNPVIMKGVTLEVTNGKTFTVPAGFTITVQDGVVETVGTGNIVLDGTMIIPTGYKLEIANDKELITSGTGKVVVDGELIVSGKFVGKIGSVSANTVIVKNGGVVTTQFDDINSVADGSIKLESGAEIVVQNEDVTLDQVTDKIKVGTEARSKIVIENTSTGNKTTYEIEAPVVTQGSVVTKVVTGQTAGTVVTLTNDPDYKFTVPAEIKLNPEQNEYKTGDVTVSTALTQSGKFMRVTIDTDGTVSDPTIFELINSADPTNPAKYKLRENNTSNLYSGKNGDNSTVISLDLGVAQSKTQKIDFVTFYNPKAAGSYTGTLTFKMEIVSDVTLDSGTAGWTKGGVTVTSPITVPSGSVITLGQLPAMQVSVTINGVEYLASSAASQSPITGFTLNDVPVVSGVTVINESATLKAVYS